LRASDCTLAGNTAEISSDVVLPNSRIKSQGDAGGTSCSGDLTTELFIDEVDDFLQAVMLSDGWVDATTDYNDERGTAYASVTKLTLGNTQNYFRVVKEYYQGSKTYEEFKKVQIGEMQANFPLNSKVGMTFSMVGVNDPQETDVSPLGEPDATLTTKSYTTRQGSIKIGDTVAGASENKQASALNLTISQNPEATDALFQTEAIDSSLGDEVINGSLTLYNTQDKATMAMYNDAKLWNEKMVVIELDRGTGTHYEFDIHATFKAPTRASDGNKLTVSLPFEVYDESNGVVIYKIVE